MMKKADNIYFGADDIDEFHAVSREGLERYHKANLQIKMWSSTTPAKTSWDSAGTEEPWTLSPQPASENN
jgi:hypothetical protein